MINYIRSYLFDISHDYDSSIAWKLFIWLMKYDSKQAYHHNQIVGEDQS